MPISDIMTVLMVIFLFISILYIKRIQQQMEIITKANEAIQEISKEYVDHKQIIYDLLKNEFEQDLKKWSAELLKDPIVIRFLSPEIMFHAGKSTIQPQFKNILLDFCPRYFSILNKFQKLIEEVRIEGHTSFEWYGAKTKLEAYFNNLKLSQNRTISVFQYCVTIRSLKPNIRNWITKNATANGLSSSKPLCLSDSINCRSLNRRVEFRVQIESEDILDKINKNLIKMQ
ncbi:MAG: OmpA family protein [Oligoflexia bacterium]|nr:OmpA family protein [Oligoflexia bacterium]